jgi:hypothetical protein
VSDAGNRLVVGDNGPVSLISLTPLYILIQGQGLLQTESSILRYLTSPNTIDTVIHVKHRVYAVAWLAINQMVSLLI